MFQAVQFIGRKNIMQAYDLRDVAFWGIWQKNCLIHKGEGREELEEFLSMLENNGSRAAYTLKLFEDATDLKQIKEKTQADGSFSFKLNEYEGGDLDSGGQYYHTNKKNKLFERLESIEEKLAGITEGDHDDDNANESFEQKLIGVISDPNQLAAYVDIFKNLFAPAAPVAVGKIGNTKQMGNTQPTAQQSQPMTEEQTRTRLVKALEILEAHDPKIIEHLESLAMLAQDKPGKFKSLLAMMDTFI